ncbi:MAG: hypothetical protein AAFR77_11735, partial [Cyanobacteria bacterium J06631_2]
MFAAPMTQVRAADYWDDKSITENVVDGDRLVGQVSLPDWDNITLEDFPPIQEGGSIGTEFNSYAGYDLSREWVAGDSLVDILKLGDVEEGFASQELSIGEIAVLTEVETNDIALSAFELAKEQSLGELVEVVPGLGQQQVSEVEPIAKLVETRIGSGYEDTSIDSLVESDLVAKELKLGEVDLSQYSIDDIPGLEDTALKEFAGWENAGVNDVPALSKVALSQMPNPLSSVAMPVMRIDAVWSDAESNRQRTVSGSYEEGFNVPCTAGSRCPYIELDDIENFGSDWRLPTEGVQWIEGRDPQSGNICPDRPWGVKGGHGVLGAINCGKEPTGRHPFGKAFKFA